MFLNKKGTLESLINLIPVPDQLTILPLTEIAPIPVPAGPPYIAMFNPESHSTDTNHNFSNARADGSTGSELKFREMAPREFSFDFLIDDTGASGTRRNVAEDIEFFKKTVGFNGETHQPNFLFIVWGHFYTVCVLRNMNTRYELFKKDGTPIRAVISASFQETKPKILEILESNRTSPDLTHRRTIKDGDKLPLMAYGIYKDARYYLEVARVNGLTSFRKLSPGRTLDFPPLEK